MDSSSLHIEKITARNPGPLTLDGTNTYVLGDTVIDPGPDDADHLECVAARSGTVRKILLTHRHPDHAAGARTLSRMTGAPVLAFEEGLSDGDEVSGLVTLHTPGHSGDHLCFWHARSETLFSGDLIAGRGSIMVAPPEGDMEEYLTSLRRVRDLKPERIMPGHGPRVTDAGAKVREYISHREEREARIVAALRAGASSVEELLESAYSDTPEAMYPYARLALRAHMIKLGKDLP
ncbi:Zn-dependent hydrolase including glyoxylase [Rubrobacter radiotolerans]|uniref:MBL fold metallo-hydrolase n=1 Tax=Rubrobacter radiotolerans TaxID=42256 RepID=A0A023X724_RUBRA|nr:MBL fold metallo-hydrolase [Rubrobacter radiotolerans]AHY47869.1 Zn-dependent hydrolase including glyoxylase [Rubrobacter radiotolerans]MDX5892507.1 MBL fold metallo-hydrolase [Rubrobacter radiotolerans]SMC07798.1 Glyoxylase, beta-lactamase superfamily II [Rubrobacter radiotolerans DSM 5868]